MELKNLKTLEYNKIIEMLESRAKTVPGKEKCRKLLPSLDINKIKREQEETGQALSIIFKKDALSLGGMKDIIPSLKRVDIGGVLNIEELLYIGDFLRVNKRAINYGKDEGDNESFDKLYPMFKALIPLNKLEREIEKAIIGPNEISDDASSELSNIRRNIKIGNERVREHLNSIIHSNNYKNALQENVITIRNGRFCVPIKQEYKNSFPGIVHDQSSSGATLFIEPSSVVNLNNRIKALEVEEEKEIEKILANLSNLVYLDKDILQGNYEILTDIDFIMAKGLLAVDMNGFLPIFNERGYINIIKGRHPLLDKKTVVPTDIYLGDEFTTLIITGPNTGGKTVSLKTLGLFTLMGQAGLHIPADEGSELSVFRQIFADIGDEQSIEQSLSTFSSHMKNIVNILDNVDSKSLVLLDELGAGTDPTEGAALAVSIIEFLLERNIVSAVTTHYSELKVFALSTDGVENASCEFDVVSLQPTFKLLIGVPGKSNAFAISRRLGLREDIIEQAKENLSKDEERFEDVITDLEISRKTVLDEQDKAEKYREEVEELKKELERQKEGLNKQRDRYISEARQEAKQIMNKAKDEADELLKELHQNVKSSRDIRKSEEIRGKIREGVKEYTDTSLGEDKPREKVRNLRKGESVYIHSLKQKGITITEPDNNGNVQIKAGIMTIESNINDLSRDDSEEITIGNKPISRKNIGPKSINISPEIDLRGMLSDEAVSRTEKYIDDAYLAGLKSITIIHGKGTGALREAIHNMLNRNPHIKNYRLGEFGEGGIGVTICELK